MNKREVTIPIIGLVAGTRLALGIGLGLLLADRLPPRSRNGAGWALVAFGALTTIPLVAEVFGASVPPLDQEHSPSQEPAGLVRFTG